MRFIHIADVHLGAQPDAGSVYSAQRSQELWEAFSEVIALCEREKMDLLLIAGDLFHRQPLLRELKEVNYLFSTLSVTKVVLIAGNHDYIRKDSYYRTFSWNRNVYPLFGRELQKVFFRELDTAVYGFSYYEREIREPLYDEVCTAVESDMRYRILLAHGGDEKHIPIRREILERSGFDYIAMGHIHKPQEVLAGRALYAGALEPIDKNDVGPHGYVRGGITSHGVRTEFVPFAKREYIHLVLKVNRSMTAGALLNWMRQVVEQRGTQNLYKFILRGFRDPDITFDAEQMYLPENVLELADETEAAYDFPNILENNRDNLIGKYIETFADCGEGSLEHQALQEGVLALMKNRME